MIISTPAWTARMAASAGAKFFFIAPMFMLSERMTPLNPIRPLSTSPRMGAERVAGFTGSNAG